MPDTSTPLDLSSYGLFVGLTSTPIYPNDINVVKIKNDILNKTFSGYKNELNTNLKENGFSTIAEDLYKPINFYAIGYFNIISLSLIDDYHFGNFSFRPQNRYLNEDVGDLNFQYQVINNHNLSLNFSNFYNIENFSFIGISKLKINSAFLLEGGLSKLRIIKETIFSLAQEVKIPIMLAESFSWHELTLVMTGDSLESMMNFINNLRFISEPCFLLKNDETEEINLLSDTETIYGMNPKLLHDDVFYKSFIQRESDNCLNRRISVSSKIQTKTGHANKVKNIISESLLSSHIKLPLKIVNGRSDYTLHYHGDSLLNFLEFWRHLIKDETLEKNLFANLRKFHSNISLPFLRDDGQKKLNNKFFGDLSSKNIFKFNEILTLENNLKSLHISKDVSASILAIYLNYNEVIKDVNLYFYFLDLKPLLVNLRHFVKNLCEEVNTDLIYRSTSYVSKVLLEFVSIFQTAYSNRFLDSKRIGYNQDIKGEFSGGVHQLIQSIDSCFKLFHKSILLNADLNHKFPIATFGNYQSGIKATSINLHINYFQIFQSEFYLFSLPKEALNYYYQLFVSEQRNNGVDFIDLHSLRKTISKNIHEESNLKFKQILFKYMNPQKLDVKINYIVYYTMFLNISWVREDPNELDDSVRCFSFWLWSTYIQNANLYNTDSSLRLDLFREHYFAFCLAIKYGTNCSLDFMSLPEENNNPYISYFLNEGGVKDEVSQILQVFEDSAADENYSNILGFIYEIKRMSSSIAKSLNDDSRHKEYQILHSIISEELECLYQIFKPEKSKIGTYMRVNKNGSAATGTDIYSSSLFDPNGGIFCLDPSTRIKVFEIRSRIFNRLRDLSYSFKKDFYLN